MAGPATIMVKDHARDLAVTGAGMFAQGARQRAAHTGRFTVVVSGGATPRQMHRLLAGPPHLENIPWNQTHIFWADERCVPEEQPASNYGAAKKDFLDHVPIPGGQIHAMPGGLPPAEGAVAYQNHLKACFPLRPEGFPVFDLIFLGVGKDGHTASLFPGQDALEETARLVMAVKGGDPHMSRLTLTLPVLNRARRIVVLVSGREKAGILKTVFEKPGTGLPVQKIRPMNGDLVWLMDREAARLLPGDLLSGLCDRHAGGTGR